MEQQPAVYVALLHYPVYHKDGKVMATSITNMDLHDISRTCMTYGIARYFVVNPLKSQQYFARRILRYWNEGHGREFNPSRKFAFSILDVRDTLEDAVAAVREAEGADPILVATDARPLSAVTEPEQVFADAARLNRPLLVLFGTGYGIAREVIGECDCFLPPIRPGGYNHLSVRAAVAIVLDRLIGEKATRSPRQPRTETVAVAAIAPALSGGPKP